MSNSYKKTVRAFLLLLALAFLTPGAVYGANADGNHIVIEGNMRTQQFRIVSGGDTLFDIRDMLPGEIAASSDVTIQNTSDLPFTLSVAVDDLGSHAPLLDYLNIVVRLDGNIIANFPAKGQSGGGFRNPYPFGVIPANTVSVIDVGLSLAPGRAMGNNLQEKSASFSWRFVAVYDDTEPQPEIPVGAEPPNGEPITQNDGDNAQGGAMTEARRPADADGLTAPGALPEIVNIGENEPPEASPAPERGTAAWSLVNLLLTILSAVFAFVMLGRFAAAKKRDCDENIAENETHRADTTKSKMGMAFIIGALGVVCAVTLFLRTEDMRLPMEYINKYTIIYAALNLIEIVALALTRKKSAYQ